MLKRIIKEPTPVFPTAVSATSDPQRQLCPLEEILTRSLRYQPTVYDLSGVTSWAAREGPDSRINALVGSVCSAHLFREPSVIHHEFMLVCFKREGVAESWVRVERAARFKRMKFMPQPDSLGPVFGGVDLRESISFGTSKEQLRGDAAELASLIIRPRSTTSWSTIQIDELASQLSDASSADPQYRLFSANCRWFARRSLLSVAQRSDAQGSSLEIRWGDGLIDLLGLEEKLRVDPFGGRQLGGTRADEIRAANLLNIARTDLSGFDVVQARVLATRALSILEAIPKPSAHQRSMMATALWYQGISFNTLHDYQEGVRCLERAKAIRLELDPKANTRLSDESLANAYRGVGRIADAIVLRREIIKSWDDTHESSPFAVEIRANSTSSLIEDLEALGGDHLEEALEEAEEHIKTRRWLADYRPDLHRRTLGKALDQKAGILRELGRAEEAFSVAVEALKITRQAFAISPDATRHALAVRLTNISNAAASIERRDVSLRYSLEAIVHCKLLNDQNTDFFLPDYAGSVRLAAANLYLAKNEHEAGVMLLENLELERELVKRDAARWSERFAIVLQSGSILLWTQSHPEGANLALETLTVSRELYDKDPMKYGGLLAKSLEQLGQIRTHPNLVDHISTPEFLEEAIRHLTEAIEIRKSNLSSSDVTQSKALAETYSLLSHSYLDAEDADNAVLAASKSMTLALELLPASPNDTALEELKSPVRALDKALDLARDTSRVDLLDEMERHLRMLRSLYEKNPTVFEEEELVDKLRLHAVWMGKQGMKEAAIFTCREALQIARRLSASVAPAHWLAYDKALANTLVVYGSLCQDVKDIATAVDSFSESILVFQGLEDPPLADLTLIAAEWASVLSDEGQNQEALDVHTQALGFANKALEEEKDPENKRTLQAALANVLFTRGALLHTLGRVDDAITTTKESLAIYRRLSLLDPNSYKHSLALCLNNLGGFYDALNRPFDAMEVGAEALDYFTALFKTDPSVGPNFKVLLNTLAREAVKYSETVIGSRVSVSVSYALYEHIPEPDLDNVIGALLKHAIKLAEAGDLEEACKRGEEALAHCRTLFATDETSARPRLAEVLQNLASDLLNAGKVEIGVTYSEEALMHYRALHRSTTSESPTEERSVVPRALYVHSAALQRLERHLACIEACEEAIAISQDPPPLDSVLTARLFGLKASSFASLGQFEDAIGASVECISYWRVASREASQFVLPDLAGALSTHPRFLHQLGRDEEAWEFMSEAVELERIIYESDPAQYWERFCDALQNLAAFSEKTGRLDVTHSAAIEMIEATKRAYEIDPSEHRDILAVRLFKQAEFESKLENWVAAAEASSQSIPLWREMFVSDPGRWREAFAIALHNDSFISVRCGRDDNAIRAQNEIVAIRRAHVAELPDTESHTALKEALKALIEVLENSRQVSSHDDIVSLIEETEALELASAMDQLDI